MLLSRVKPASEINSSLKSTNVEKTNNNIPELEDFLKKRDFTGAIALLQYNRKAGNKSITNDLWIGYCYFHLGEYKEALKEYERIITEHHNETTITSDDNSTSNQTNSLGLNKDFDLAEIWAFIACCQFYLGMYKEAQESTNKTANKSPLLNRLRVHLCQKLNDEKTLIQHHQQLQDALQDQLCLASIHYLRSHYQEAIDIYKKTLLDHRDFLALNVYIALCYYKLDYYDVSQEVLTIYLQDHPDSVTATNLKACNHYRLYNGKAAESELRSLIDSASPSFSYAKDLIRHNLIVFRNGECALQVLPSLVDVLPEARLNLIIYYLKNDDLQQASNLIKNLEPTNSHEHILKAVVCALVGQEHGSRENLKMAQQNFQLVGGSPSECDTIPGRQCMASCFFILKQFDDVLLYLSSIKSYFYNDDTFNLNYGQAKAATNNFKEAEEILLLIQSEKIKNDFVYISWLVRCFIMNKKPKLAWELYLKKENSQESYSLLQLIANDCYKMGQFLYSAKAFDKLEKIDQNPEFWEGKRGACVGVLQMIIAEKEPKESIHEVIRILRGTSNSQSNQIINAIKSWAKENKISV